MCQHVRIDTRSPLGCDSSHDWNINIVYLREGIAGLMLFTPVPVALLNKIIPVDCLRHERPDFCIEYYSDRVDWCNLLVSQVGCWNRALSSTGIRRC